jgi:predicted transposase/invertase (TIGR01784 family)
VGILEAPHDTFFRTVFRHPVHAASWLCTLLPEPVRAAIDWSSLTAAPPSAHGVHLRRHHADLVFAARLHHSQEPLLVLIEHKHDGGPDLPSQLQRYVVHLRRAAQRRARGTEPLVVPVVLHHGRAPLVPTTGHPHLAALAFTTASAFAALQLQLAFLVDDLVRHDEAELHRPGLTPFAELGLLCLRVLPGLSPMHALAAMQRWAPLLRAADSSDDMPGGEDAIDAILWYCLAVTEVDETDLSELLARILQRPEGTLMSTLERIHRQRFEQGLAEGKAEGKTEGKTEGRIETILRLLARRFGPLPADSLARVRAGSIGDLDRWTDRILDAKTLADLFD